MRKQQSQAVIELPNDTAEVQAALDASGGAFDFSEFDGAWIESITIQPDLHPNVHLYGNGTLNMLPMPHRNGGTMSKAAFRIWQAHHDTPDMMFESWRQSSTAIVDGGYQCPHSSSGDNKKEADELGLGRNAFEHRAGSTANNPGFHHVDIDVSVRNCGNTALVMDWTVMGQVRFSMENVAGHCFAIRPNSHPRSYETAACFYVYDSCGVNVGNIDWTGNDNWEDVAGGYPVESVFEDVNIVQTTGRNKLNHAVHHATLNRCRFFNPRSIDGPQYAGLTITRNNFHALHVRDCTFDGFPRGGIEWRGGGIDPADHAGRVTISNTRFRRCDYAFVTNGQVGRYDLNNLDLGEGVELCN